MRYYKGPLPASLRQYRDAIVGLQSDKKGDPIALVHCARYGCHNTLPLTQKLAGEPTCSDCSFFTCDGHINTDLRMQPYAKQVLRAERRLHGGAGRVVWWYRCVTPSCAEEVFETQVRKRNGLCWPCSRAANTEHGVYARKHLRYLKLPNVVSAKVTANGHTAYTVRCADDNCGRQTQVFKPHKIENKFCRRCSTRRANNWQPFNYQYLEAIKGAARRGIDFAITLSQYQLLCRAKNCFYCHVDFNRQPYLDVTKPKPKGWRSHFMDRIDPKKGYSISNVIPCCGRCNLRRGRHLSVQDALALGRAATYGIKAAARIIAAKPAQICAVLHAWQRVVWSAQPMPCPKGLSMEWNTEGWYCS